ncbi:MAG TPA: class F sortase [Streptosporangiaceae bacterium]|nr:class F sortase [Streptosporangiaceae bacterium]
MAWPHAGYAALPPGKRGSIRGRAAGVIGVLLILSGTTTVITVVGTQGHAPQPASSAAGATRSSARGLSLRHSLPVSIDIPAIGVKSTLLRLGLNSDGTMRVPSLDATPGRAAWYRYSAAPGQIGVSVIEGHVDTYRGPGVFYRLGDLRPGDVVEVRLADGTTAVFRITGVRQYLKSKFPARIIYAATRYSALRLITCGGNFDHASGHYVSATVVFASLASAR